MSQVAFLMSVDQPWLRMEPVRLGQVPRGLDTPDRFVVVESNDGPLLRLDLYSSGDECYAFEEAYLWSGFVVIGWGHHVYLVDPRTRSVLVIDLGSYFGHLYPQARCLLVASAERLFCIELDGSVLWQTEVLGIDGVVVDQVEDGVVRGNGEWDPPGGWRPFQVSLISGKRCNR